MSTLERAIQIAAWEHRPSEQRREMMTKWADYLDKLRDGANVVPLKAG